MAEPLALQLPLTGVQLIEASAGTGKTYTIADFFVRLLIEGRHDIRNILVVTFTRAASEELRDRIRTRISEAIDAFATGNAGGNDTLAGLLEVRGDHDQVAETLIAARTRMDEAAVFTIHSFCQQMLQQFAFESGAAFDATFEFDEECMLESIVYDFWRRRFYPEPRPLVEVVNRLWQGPQGLLSQLRPFFRTIAPEIRPAIRGESLIAEVDQYLNLLRGLPREWATSRAEVTEILRGHQGLSRAQDKYSPERVARAISRMDLMSAQDYQGYILPDEFAFFTQTRISAAGKKRYPAPEHPFFAFCQKLATHSETVCRTIEMMVLREAAEYVRRELTRRKRDINALSYDDLLTQLHRALIEDEKGRLLAAIRGCFPVALIDEFQDTDPLQYEIFWRLYQNSEKLGLFMIGDPKQAIYGFRGADVFTYMAARRASDGFFTLPKNWRSTRPLVEGVNALFGYAGGRAFVYHDDIPFNSVSPSDNPDQTPLTIDGDPPVPIKVWFLGKIGGKFSSKAQATAAVVPACAAEISRLIALGQAGRARIGDKPLQAEDIAVLVRSRFEADAVKDQLNGLNIASVFISQESVFESAEAAELVQVLKAVAEPGDEYRLRAALCTRMLGANNQALFRMQENEDEWERCLQRFQGYRERWLSRGFMAMLGQLLVSEGVIDRVLGMAGGERSMTNIRHLSELLQEASQSHAGIEELVAWLETEQRLANGNNEEQQLRLETDQKLVKIVTIHKSKGLQYPIVFLPYAWMGRRALQVVPPVVYHASGGTRQVIDLGSQGVASGHALAETERLAEDVRLLYVAVTRAEHLCYLPCCAVSYQRHGRRGGIADSAMAWLLYQDPDRDDMGVEQLAKAVLDMDDTDLRKPWENLSASHPHAFALEAVPTESGIPLHPETRGSGRAGARPFQGRIVSSWEMTSYSRLTAGHHHLPRAIDLDILGEPDQEGPSRLRGSEQLIRNVFTFPRGPKAGNFIHGLLERLDFPKARGDDLNANIEQCLNLYNFDPEWQPVVASMVSNILDSRLGGDGGFCLRDIGQSNRLSELEFHFRLGSVRAEPLNAFLSKYSSAHGRELEPLDFNQVKGFMTGFIDLVVGHAGRYFIIDYKSNHLGDHPGDYAREGLARAILEHRYDLQYLIYVVALLRYLRYRIPNYDYDTHFGGVYYLFVRGMEASAGTDNGVFFDRPDRALLKTLDNLLSTGAGDRE